MNANWVVVWRVQLIFNFSNFLFNFLMVVTTPRIAAALARPNSAREVRWCMCPQPPELALASCAKHATIQT